MPPTLDESHVGARQRFANSLHLSGLGSGIAPAVDKRHGYF